MPVVSRVLRKLRAVRHKSRLQLLWLAPAWVVLGLGRGAILLLSFERLVRLLGLQSHVCPLTPLLEAGQRETALDLGRTILLASSYAPWRANCFPQALCAILLLRIYRIPHAVFLGLLREHPHGKIKAHAWVSAGAVTVTGGGNAQPYTIVGCFS
ncbi:lasso peptide biosynthesis B2 protein [Blastomonas aquatica]|uniref:lasso peptide biosynthesis B2 protein n=1 Tax=Blastomonas aquatica TaxID=1510276 RepID=UPI00166C2877